MATSADFIEYVCSQLDETGFAITKRKMFGEYMIYADAKPIFTVCDNTVYIKILDCLGELLAECEQGSPYDGAKVHYIIDPDNKELLCEVTRLAEPFIKIPIKKKRKKAADVNITK